MHVLGLMLVEKGEKHEPLNMQLLLLASLVKEATGLFPNFTVLVKDRWRNRTKW